jgi:hypothetical protein
MNPLLSIKGTIISGFLLAFVFIIILTDGAIPIEAARLYKMVTLFVRSDMDRDCYITLILFKFQLWQRQLQIRNLALQQ